MDNTELMHQRLVTLDSHQPVEASDSTHPGGTWSEERESLQKQVRLVTAVVIAAAIIVFLASLAWLGRD